MGADGTDGEHQALAVRVLERVAATAASSGDLGEVLSEGLVLAMEAGRAAAGAIYVHDALRELFECRAECGVDHARVLEAARVDALLARPAPPDEAALYLPLKAGGQLVGLFVLALDAPGEIAPAILRTLEALASFLASAIRSAHTQEQLERRARLALELRTFGERALALAPEPDLYRLILDTALALTGLGHGLIARVFGDRSRVLAGVGKDEALVGISLANTEPLLAEALGRDGPVIVEDTAALDPDTAIAEVARRNHTASFMMFAMRHQGRPVGHLFVAADRPRRFLPEEIEAMRILATMAAEVLERARMHAAAEGERRRLDALIEHLPIAIAVFEGNGKLEHVNAAARDFGARFGYRFDRDWRVEMGDAELYHVDGTRLAYEEIPFVRAFTGERPPPTEILVRGSGRQATVMVVATPLTTEPDGAVESVALGFQDVSALRELADAKDRFLRIASHELRSPITSLRATAELLELAPAALDGERRHALLGRMRRQVDRLTRLVEQLLDGARLNGAEIPLQPVECDLTAIAREAIEQAAEQKGQCRLVFEPDGPVCGRWDPHRLEQVLGNLIGNAIRYSPAGGTIIVRVAAENGEARMEVRDQGIGIPAEQLDRVFDPFFRATNAVRVKRGEAGLGLGLHITAEIVRRHRGRIEVESEVGRGTCFTVRLPRE